MGGEHQMPTEVDLYVSSQEPVWNVVFLYIEVKVCWILWSQLLLVSVGNSGYVFPLRNTWTGTSFRSSKKTSSTMADAALNISTAALGLTFAVMLAANVAPTSAAWLWAFQPR